VSDSGGHGSDHSSPGDQSARDRIEQGGTELKEQNAGADSRFDREATIRSKLDGDIKRDVK
jgi:hypothetical protein